MNEESIFSAAVKKRSTTERDAFLQEACQGNVALQGRLAGLLRAHDQPDSFLDAPATGDMQPAVAPEFAHTVDTADARIGSTIGRYKLLEQIGEGGMGVVYVAEQTEPVRRRVALKIIKPGMDTKQVIARFEAERQALAMMDHPNIAKILDAGTTGEGTRDQEPGAGIQANSSLAPGSCLLAPSAARPYFVMELVRGMPITDYCDQAKLSPRQRLELFVDVCQAVQHAHQKGIIHRDLKPSNVMITLHDGTPVVKVIDFGVAKATTLARSASEGHTVYTALNQIVGTPLYMSPEQAELTSHDVDTRSDVYSLGVLLYELLTGQTPFDKETLAKAGLDEMRRIIREDEPETVSQRLARTRREGTRGSGLGTKGSDSEGRPSIPNPEPRIPGIPPPAPRLSELDWIVMKSLEKDRSRRYESASALAADIQRYLSDEPVLACPPTTMYRFQKFARKHKPALFTAVAIAACLLLGTTVSAWQAVRATTAEAQANANEQKAVANAAAAQEKEQEAVKQRDEVKALNDRLAAKEQQLQRTLYAAHMNLAKNAWDASDTARVEELLNQHDAKQGETDFRGFEWHYLSRLSHSELFKLKGHTGEVTSVAFSPDGKRLATASADKMVKVWDAQTGRERLSINGEMGEINSVTFSPDGTRLAGGSGRSSAIGSGGRSRVKVWDAQTGAELLMIREANDAVAFSPDGKRLVTPSDWEGGLKVWDAQSGEEVLKLKGHSRSVWSVAYSPDGKRLASASQYDPVKVWDAKTGQELLSLAGYDSVGFSPDGKRLASAGNPEAKVWDAETGQQLLSLKPGGNSVSFSPDGKRLAVGSWKGTTRIWDLESGQEIRSFKGGGSLAVFSPDGQRLASKLENTVKVWDAQHDQESLKLEAVGRGAGIERRSLALSPDFQRMASAAADNTIIVRDARTEQGTLTLKGHTAPILSVAFSPDGKRLASGSGSDNRLPGEVKIWDAQTGREPIALTGHTAAVRKVVFSADGKRLASATTSATPGKADVKVWDAQTGQEVHNFPGGASSMAFSQDGTRLATGGGGYGPNFPGQVKVWDLQTGQELHSLKQHTGRVWSVAFSPDGKRLAGSGEGGVHVWNAVSGQEIFSLKGHTHFSWSVAYSPDGKRLASPDGDSTVKVWDAQTGHELLTLTGDISQDSRVAFSPDGKRLANVGRRSVTIWNATPLPEKP